MISADILRDKMNEYGAQKIPFIFIVDFELSNGIFIEYPMEQQEVLFRTQNASNIREYASNGGKEMKILPITYADYKQRFDIVMNGLLKGNSFLTNLTVKTPVFTELSLKDILLLSNSPYGVYAPGQFVCFSPERFVRIENGIISTNPMKGTINANIPNAENVLLSDFKETAEHYTIVDLLRNDIGIVANDIRVEKFRYIDRITTKNGDILQTSSEITGRLHEGYFSRLGDIIFHLLPAGSISGAPKISTVNIIRQTENEPRGFYTGVFGYFDGNELDSAVIIRYLEEHNGQKYFRSGGGITVYSDPKSEYKEVLEKIYLPLP